MPAHRLHSIEFGAATGVQLAVQPFNRPFAHAGCQLFLEAIRRIGSLACDKLREALLALKTNFAIDERGFQVGHKTVTTQGQDGKQIVVWPADLASGKPRFPTPPQTE